MRLLFIAILFSSICQGQTPMRWLTKRQVASDDLILDSFPSANVAYSLRKLDKDYSGSCIRVRESGGNTEQNIGFINNVLDTAALKTFVGSNSGYVVTWYDQSGNGWNASQSTSARQPRIVNAGVVERQGGNVTLRFITQNNRLDISITSTSFTSHSIFTVFYPLNVSYNFSRVVCFRKTTSAHDYQEYVPILSNGTVSNQYGSYQGASRAYVTVSTSAFNLYNNIETGTTIKNSVNNGTEQTYSYSLNQSVTTYTIGASDNSDGSLDSGFDGYITEVIAYNADKSSNRSAINSNINRFYLIY